MTYNRAATLIIQIGISILLATFVSVFFVKCFYGFAAAPSPYGVSVSPYLFTPIAGCLFFCLHHFVPHLWDRLARLLESAHDGLVEEATFQSSQELCCKILIVAATSLFLELLLIRWQSNLFPLFALYKNYILLACFCGLGIGYAMAQERLVLPAALPLLATLIGLLSLLRYRTGLDIQMALNIVPIREEAYVAAAPDSSHTLTYIKDAFPVYAVLITSFVMNALILIPIGQYCGFLMNKVKPLQGYGANLLGSILGVGMMVGISAEYGGPIIWFSMATCLILWMYIQISSVRTLGLGSLFIILMLVGWPFTPFTQTLYSPYQMIQVIAKEDGLSVILAAGTYFQKIFNLSTPQTAGSSDPVLAQVIGHYELPFKTAASLDEVAVVGAGTGNDVAAALRYGAKSVKAIEIDPAIYKIGVLRHPEHPYENPHVEVIINDARNFFRTEKQTFDAIIYGVLDSHILISNGANVRLDSFVYTQEGLQESFDHLKPGGILSVSFALQTTEMGQKIFDMMSVFPNAGAPVAVVTGYDNNGTTVYMVRRGETIDLPQDFMKDHHLKDVTANYQKNLTVPLNLPSDDWPFFYMSKRSFPTTYVISLLLIVFLSSLLIKNFLPKQKPQLRLTSFFFLGSGFMLIETKSITELGLLYGNTWQVVALAILGVLVMAFLANWICICIPTLEMGWAWALLGTVIVLGYLSAKHGNHFAYAPMGLKFGKVVLVTIPLLFSGIIFSRLLDGIKDTSGAMAHNLAGAMLGGILEYNAMQFGFASLYLIALFLYGAAWATSRYGSRHMSAPS